MHITFHPRTATFFFNDTATTEIYTLSLHDALPISRGFTVNLFVEGLNGVRYLALGPGGAVYASLPGAGQIVRLVEIGRAHVWTPVTATSPKQSSFCKKKGLILINSGRCSTASHVIN